jgi:hypothetical protein
MPRVYPFHSRNPHIPVSERRFHDNSLCYDGNNIELIYKTPGTGDYPRCHTCTRLAAQGR